MATLDRATVLWVGPVTAANLSAVELPPGWALKVVNQGNPDPDASPGAAPPAIRAGAFRRLITASDAPDPLAAVAGDDDLVLLCAFSAGGGFVDEVLRRPILRKRVVGVLCADAIFVATGADVAKTHAGHVRGALRAFTNAAPYWATCGSDAGPGHLSGVASVNLLVQEVPGAHDISSPVLTPPSASCLGGGSLRLMAYPAVKHVEHATKLAARALRQLLADHFDFDRPLKMKLPAPSSPGGSGASKYQWRTTSPRGVVEVRGTPEAPSAFTPIAVRPKDRGAYDGALEWLPLARAASKKRGVPLSWVIAVIAAESGGDPAAKSPVGARGLMQVMPATAAAYGVDADALDDPAANVDLGARILSDLRGKFDLPAVASRYNAGPSQKTGVKLSSKSPWGYVEDPGYIERVVRANNEFALHASSSSGARGSIALPLAALGAVYLATRGRS